MLCRLQARVERNKKLLFLGKRAFNGFRSIGTIRQVSKNELGHLATTARQGRR